MIKKIIGISLCTLLAYNPMLFAVSTDSCYDTDVVLMMHMDGTDGDNMTFTDNSTYAHSFTAVADAQLDTSDKKFGTASLLLDGTGDALSASDAAEFDQSGDWGVDLWVNFSAFGGASSDVFLNHGDTAASRWQMAYNDASKNLIFRLDNAGNLVTCDKTTVGLVTGTWYHIALQHSGDNFQWFLDGTQVGTTCTDTDDMPNIAGGFEIGARDNAGLGLFMHGWMDEIRYVGGTAIWTSDFTPPSAAYTVCGAATSRRTMLVN